MRNLAVIDCVGDAREVGLSHGRAARDLVAKGLGAWLDGIAAIHGDPDRYLDGFIRESGHLATAERLTPHLVAEVRGIAEGAGQPFNRIWAYNLLDEEWAYSKATRAVAAPGCTVAGIIGADGVAYLAQTMDIPTVHDGTQVALRINRDGAVPVIAFAYAGMIALNGANAAGVGVLMNNLGMLSQSRDGLPVVLVSRGILDHETAGAAADWVRSVPHAIGQHYAIGGPDGFASLEGSPAGVWTDEGATHRVLHANHPLLATDVSPDAEAAYQRSNTRARLGTLGQKMAGVTDQAGVEAALSDTSAPISCEPRNGAMTFGATSLALTVPPKVRIAPGPPHMTDFVEVPFAD